MLQLQTIDNIETHTGVIAFSHDSHSGHQCDIVMVAVNFQSSDSDEYQNDEKLLQSQICYPCEHTSVKSQKSTLLTSNQK